MPPFLSYLVDTPSYMMYVAIFYDFFKSPTEMYVSAMIRRNSTLLFDEVLRSLVTQTVSRRSTLRESILVVKAINHHRLSSAKSRRCKIG